MVTGLFRPGWPVPALFATPLGCGFLVSFQFNACHTVAYSDMEAERMNRVTSFYATVQQLSLSLGVAVAGLTFAMRVRGPVRPASADSTPPRWR